MTVTFLILAALTVVGTAAAMGMRNAVHCVLALTVGFAGVAALYLQLVAQFVGFTQIMVYVGAVAILAVFAIMMTHHPARREARCLLVPLALRQRHRRRPYSQSWPGPSSSSATAAQHCRRSREVSVQQIGESLMHRYVLPLEIMGLLLTAALIGAVVIAMDRQDGGDEMTSLQSYLLLSSLLFSIGLAGALTRRNAILVLIGIELMLNSANLNFIAFWRFGPGPRAPHRDHVRNLLHQCRRSRSRSRAGHHPGRIPALQDHRFRRNEFPERLTLQTRTVRRHRPT